MKWPTQTNQAQHQLQNRQSKILKKKNIEWTFRYLKALKLKVAEALAILFLS